jgi:hypothetical protein
MRDAIVAQIQFYRLHKLELRASQSETTKNRMQFNSTLGNLNLDLVVVKS